MHAIGIEILKFANALTVYEDKIMSRYGIQVLNTGTYMYLQHIL